MPAVDEFRNFWQRRMRIPVSGNALVLDIGSGDKPHWRADVLLDWLPGTDSAAQRSGAEAARVSRPLFHGDAGNMPFADGAFDYVICSHLLEHVHDPRRCPGDDARRPGRLHRGAGGRERKILDFPTHLWWVRLIDGVLDFEPKRARSFDPEIAAYLVRSGLEREMEALLDSRFEHRAISLRWNGVIPHHVRGPVDPAMVAEAAAANVRHGAASVLVATALTASAAAIDHRRHPRRVTFNQVVKPELRLDVDQRLRDTIYRV